MLISQTSTLKTVDEWTKAAASALKKKIASIVSDDPPRSLLKKITTSLAVTGVNILAKPAIRACSLLGNKAGHYLHDIRSLCIIPPKNTVTEQDVAKVVVHELGHAVYHFLLGETPLQDDVGPHLSEGFAEYVSLNSFTEHYEMYGIETLLLGKMRDHKWASTYDPDKYSRGYCFFKAAADAGYGPEDVLLHPPVSLEHIANPETYIDRRRQYSE